MSNDPASPYVDINRANFVLGSPDEWTYTMRREMQEIVPGLYLGPYAAAGKKNFSRLETAGVTHVVCVRQEIERNFIKPNFEPQLKYLVITLADSCIEAIIPKIKETKEFIDKSLAAGGKVLVHCNDGMSRSASLVIAYIMQTYGMDFRSALHYVQQRRFCVQPNDGFEQQLKEFEPIYRALIENRIEPEVRQSNVSVKRDREDESDDEDSEDLSVKYRVKDNRTDVTMEL